MEAIYKEDAKDIYTQLSILRKDLDESRGTLKELSTHCDSEITAVEKSNAELSQLLHTLPGEIRADIDAIKTKIALFTFVATTIFTVLAEVVFTQFIAK